ncbi:hypothetical protein CIHG_07870 [Coccidioides immitis H538.4]|uniref:Uncharacterized protein n=1 Tax=Coccidioides immitis H538.4 TaxID=396776 RepID=A0A0J8RYG9_COCIT|nr:hypothetical protein CIHG_07870 [Coccidioides immitis H538.4]
MARQTRSRDHHPQALSRKAVPHIMATLITSKLPYLPYQAASFPTLCYRRRRASIPNGALDERVQISGPGLVKEGEEQDRKRKSPDNGSAIAEPVGAGKRLRVE